MLLLFLYIWGEKKSKGLTNNRSYPYPFSPVPHYVCYNAIMRKKELALEIIQRLKDEYPDLISNFNKNKFQRL